ncbi:MAG: catalase family protein [Alphaproteobacteria bacterium]|nr:catalase family protein [Alphaproteobacteria bacterium]
MQNPVKYSPSVETLMEDETETIAGLKDTLTDIMDITSENGGHAIRSVHAKSHGIIQGTLDIMPDLPTDYAQGLFATLGAHPAVLRISTNPGDILHDKISLPRGLALKVLNVDGPRLTGSEGNCQDFVMINGPAFAAPDPKAFLGSLKLLAKTTDRVEWAKKAASAVLRGVNKALHAVGTESATVELMGGAPNVHPLGETYYSQTPYRFGDYIAKFSLAPSSDTLRDLTGEIIDASERHDAIREEVARDAQKGPMVWHLRVQLCRDLKTMPIEDATVVWDEEASPFVTVATLTAGSQTGWSEARADTVDEGMRFSPWTGLAAHQPLGSVNRARKDSYRTSADYRARVNGCPYHEPQSLDLRG